MGRVNRKVQLIILLVLVCLVGTMSIAYAVLSTTLNINGTAQVQDASWNVHFDNIEVNSASVNATKIPTITDSKTIDFSVVLNKPGDFYKFNVDIVNNGSISAMIDSIIKTPDLTSDQAKYIKYEIEYINGESINTKQLLASGETKSISVLISYRTDISASDLPSTNTSLNLSIQLNYVQADNTSTEITTSPKKISVKSGDLNTVGSEICIGEECFYLMKNDGRNVTMLAKYNLYVGNYCTDANTCIAYGNEATGIQNSTMIAVSKDYTFPRTGTILFSSIVYWDSGGLKSEYGINYPAYVYNSNSNLYKYVENYKIYLEGQGLNIEKARLIKIEELEKLGCILDRMDCTDAPSWVYTSSYWTGSVYNDYYVIRVNTRAAIGNNAYANAFEYGLRPVIDISLTEF